MAFREIVRTSTTFGLAKRFLKNQTNLHLHPVRAMSTEAGNVIAERVGNKGVITLDRPKALNALSLSMIRQIYQTLKKWHADPGMKMVIIKADKDSKAFSVGGDVKAVVNDQDSNLRDIFFREVYILNNLIG
ncbi:3-hydroxyisobutyryl-CoA hydrolase, mitochondrial [Ixodes scapularis]